MPSDAVRIKPIAYNRLSVQDDSIVSGENFFCKAPFLILSSKPIPKNTKAYMEVTVTHHPANKQIRHIPIFVGVHKEPSAGMLNADFCLGSVYYTMTRDYDIMERYNFAGDITHQTVPKLYAKIPIVDTVIGVGVDMTANKISIYSDGNLFYSFSPKTWKLGDQKDDIYFAIYTLYYEELGGFINYGRYRTKYLPGDYWDMYQHYYDKIPYTDEENESNDLKITFFVDGLHYDNFSNKYLTINANINNSIAPVDETTHERRVFLQHKFDNMNYTNDCSFLMTSRYDEKANDVYNLNADMTTVNLPIPLECPVYFEFMVKQGHLKENYQGIPISICVSNRKNDIEVNSVRAILAHETYHQYEIVTKVDGREGLTYTNNNILSPSNPSQPNLCGVLIDIKKHLMQIYVEGELFTEIDLSMGGWKFDTYSGLYYVTLRCEDKFVENTFNGECFFGEDDDITYTPDYDGYMTYYDYYNYTIKYPVEPKEMIITFSTLPYKVTVNRYFQIEFFVPGEGNTEEARFSPGMNKLFDTYNIISDKEPYINEPDITAFELDDIIESDKNERRDSTSKDFNISFKVKGASRTRIMLMSVFDDDDVVNEVGYIWNGSCVLTPYEFGIENHPGIVGTVTIEKEEYNDMKFLDGSFEYTGVNKEIDLIEGQCIINDFGYFRDILFGYMEFVNNKESEE